MLLESSPFGATAPITIRLVDIPEVEGKLRGMKMEIDDSNFPGSPTIEIVAEGPAAFKDADCLILIGGKPRGPGMQRKDLLQTNVSLFIRQAGFANKGCVKPTCKVLVVANPCNTNALFFARHLEGVPKSNVNSMSLLDQLRAKSLIGFKLGVPSEKVKDVVSWGNHSDSMFIDASRARVEKDGTAGELGALTEDWRKDELQRFTKTRGAEIIKVKGSSSVYSAARAAYLHLKLWFQGSDNELVSFGVINEHFGTELCVSVPVTVDKAGVVTPHISRLDKLADWERKAINESVQELKEEQAMGRELDHK